MDVQHYLWADFLALIPFQLPNSGDRQLWKCQIRQIKGKWLPGHHLGRVILTAGYSELFLFFHFILYLY